MHYKNLKRLLNLLFKLLSPPKSEELDLGLEATGVTRVLAEVNETFVDGDVVPELDVDKEERLTILGLLELEN